MSLTIKVVGGSKNLYQNIFLKCSFWNILILWHLKIKVMILLVDDYFTKWQKAGRVGIKRQWAYNKKVMETMLLSRSINDHNFGRYTIFGVLFYFKLKCIWSVERYTILRIIRCMPCTWFIRFQHKQVQLRKTKAYMATQRSTRKKK